MIFDGQIWEFIVNQLSFLKSVSIQGNILSGVLYMMPIQVPDTPMSESPGQQHKHGIDHDVDVYCRHYRRMDENSWWLQQSCAGHKWHWRY